MSVADWDTGDIRAPDLIARVDLQVPQQVGILLVSFALNTQARLRVGRLDAHTRISHCICLRPTL